MNSHKKRATFNLKLFVESIGLALFSLKEDKFRTLLSLFGVTVGIFSIVAVFTIVDALKANVETGLKSFGGSTIYVQPFPFTSDVDGEYRWWEFIKRPNISFEEFTFLNNNSNLTKDIAFASFKEMSVNWGRNSFSGALVIGHTYQWEKLVNAPLKEGRYFTPQEASSTLPIAIIGSSIVDELFSGEEPIGKEIKIGNKRVRVIGTLKEAGESMVNIIDTDNAIWVPLHFSETIFPISSSNPLLCLNSYEGVEREEFLMEVRSLMRASRRLRVGEPDNFALNEMSFLLDVTQSIFSQLVIAGWIIASFSILIGVIGIANIMFVSVKERSHQIGIQKALGAKKRTILTQFLVEAAVLSISGGVVGILLVWILILFVGGNNAFPLSLSILNLLLGIVVATATGVIAGFAPALSATRLTPVEAMNS